jgi:hypothetical protein
LPPPCWPRRATSRSIHLEPLSDLGHISKPEHQQISPRWLYAYELTLIDTSASLYQSIRQCRLAVIDVSDNAEVSNVFHTSRFDV